PPQGYNYFCGYLCPERYYGGGYGGGYEGYNSPTYPRSSSDYNFEDYNDYSDYSYYEDNGNNNQNDNYNQNDYNNNSGYNDYGNNDRYGSNNRYPGDSYDPFYQYGFRYDPYFFNTAYLRIAPRLWVFIPINYF